MNKTKNQLLTIASILLGFFGYFIIPVEGLGQGRDGTIQVDHRRRSEFAAVTGVICSSSFSWMNNEKGQSPCMVVAYIEGACTEGVWNIPPLQPDSHYDPPNATISTVNVCSCSWSSYNLLSACTACQGMNSSILTWEGYSAECPSSESNSVFPSGYTLSSNTSIPYWAATNPNEWSSAMFDVDQAQTLAHQRPDLTPGASSARKPSLVGPIIGGVVGGMAILVAAGIAGFVLYKRKKDAKPIRVPDRDESGGMESSEMLPHREHMYWPSRSSTYSTVMTEAPVERGGPRYPSPGAYSVRSYITRTSSPLTGSIVSLQPDGTPVV
ncbi:hypothetical protein SERLA73DRAFT_188716 [Serpula lacrymans var. lacrymans S7.3]|uniref:Transmembrane protein n=2 Tax=Serpula lacrymans var. lacrymans TaxID=341189 RepID=F8QC08_SERL3|nr:uncharacterized protein SERLADRAFT_479115 [Serpula lacrymans var. lacrymans S7.9]EGN94127.1 hypothetical protein SERLA73DRAFT_188716 [Serpula lacrymans var. lacrymans S7.3]EGO19561.1 hypothetical protein SERLADRAFT_479115 [Serpula lacrymans var. lacrymans S7.9]